MQRLDPYQRPPASIRNVYKKYQKMTLKELDQDCEIIDLSSDVSESSSSRVRIVEEWRSEDLITTFGAFAGDHAQLDAPTKIPVYEHEDMLGKAILQLCIYSLAFISQEFCLGLVRL